MCEHPENRGFHRCSTREVTFPPFPASHIIFHRQGIAASGGRIRMFSRAFCSSIGLLTLFCGRGRSDDRTSTRAPSSTTADADPGGVVSRPVQAPFSCERRNLHPRSRRRAGPRPPNRGRQRHLPRRALPLPRRLQLPPRPVRQVHRLPHCGGLGGERSALPRAKEEDQRPGLWVQTPS